MHVMFASISFSWQNSKRKILTEMHILCISSRKSSFAIGDSEPTLSTWAGGLGTQNVWLRLSSSLFSFKYLENNLLLSRFIEMYCHCECKCDSESNAQCATPYVRRSFVFSFQFSILLCRILFILFLSTALLSAYRLTHYGSTFRLFHYFIRFSYFFFFRF